MENCDLDLWRVLKMFKRLSSVDVGNAEFLVLWEIPQLFMVF